MEGWIKIHRSICNHWIFKDAEKYKAWITILIEVNHTDNKVNLGGRLFECKRGDSLNSLDTWAKLFGKKWDKSKVRRFFKLLERDSMIVLKNESKTTRLTVCNYEGYQGERNADETEVTRKRNGSDTQTTPNKNEKNEKNGKNEKEYSSEIRDFTNSVSKYFDRDIINKLTDKQKSNWKDTVDKLIRLDNYTKEEIKKAVKFGREDTFWKDVFLTLPKLRKKKDDVSYMHRFLNSSNKPKTNGNNQQSKEYSNDIWEQDQ